MPRSKEPSTSAEDFLPERRTLKTLRRAAQAKARVMFVGEQPGDKEDQQGHPFVGPAVVCSTARRIKPQILVLLGGDRGSGVVRVGVSDH